MQEGDIVGFEITSDPYYREGVVQRVYDNKTCRIVVAYCNRKVRYIKKISSLKIIKKNDTIKEEKENGK